MSNTYESDKVLGLPNVDQELSAHAYNHCPDRRHPRSVSFSRKHMPGAVSRSPGHRTGASPSRSALRGRARLDQLPNTSNSSSDEKNLNPTSGRRRGPVVRSPRPAADSDLRLTAPAEWKSTADVAKEVYRLWTQVDSFAKNFRPGTAERGPLEFLLLNKQHAKTVRYVGYLGLATKDGLAGWERLLTEQQSLQALVSACIGHALLEHVFDQPWFGVDSDNNDLFAVSDQNAKEVDAFVRREQHASHSKQCNEGAASMHSPRLRAFKTATYRLSARVWRLLEPLYQLGEASHVGGEWPSRKLLLDLHSIVETAAHLSRQLRLYPSGVFEWMAVSKGVKFDPNYMEAVNIGEMLETTPYVQQPDGRGAVLREGTDREHSQPISLVAVYPGLRMHFREDGPPIQSSKRFPGTMSPQTRMATQSICKTVVLLHWGKASLAVELSGDGTYHEAAKKGDLSRFERDRQGCVQLRELFIQIHGRDAFVQEQEEDTYNAAAISA